MNSKLGTDMNTHKKHQEVCALYKPIFSTPTLRETFGIIDPKTGKKYSDILHSFLIAATLNADDLDRMYIYPSLKQALKGEVYKLHVDSVVKREIRKNKECKCIISYQTRTDFGKIAFARVFDVERMK